MSSSNDGFTRTSWHVARFMKRPRVLRKGKKQRYPLQQDNHVRKSM